ncbi:MAG: hypothetical protein ACM3Q2_18740, partial [Syntrophothermus sp.]
INSFFIFDPLPLIILFLIFYSGDRCQFNALSNKKKAGLFIYSSVYRRNGVYFEQYLPIINMSLISMDASE